MSQGQVYYQFYKNAPWGCTPCPADGRGWKRPVLHVERPSLPAPPKPSCWWTGLDWAHSGLFYRGWIVFPDKLLIQQYPRPHAIFTPGYKFNLTLNFLQDKIVLKFHWHIYVTNDICKYQMLTRIIKQFHIHNASFSAYISETSKSLLLSTFA